MRVDIEKRHIDSYQKIAREANKAVKRAGLKIQKGKYKRDLLQKNISVENKKNKLAKNLHKLIISTFSINANKAKKKTAYLKENMMLIRCLIHNIKSINNYLEESLLHEFGFIKKSLIVKAVKSDKPERYLEKTRVMPKGYIDKIEHTVYELMQKIIFFDKKLLKDYKKREVKVIKKEKFGIRDMENTLNLQSQLLDALEAKIPPAGKIKPKLFKKEMFSKWVPMIFALLSSFEAEHHKEALILSKIKKNAKLRKKIEKKIRYIIDEKEKILKIKEKKALAMKSFGKISDDYRQTVHEYVTAAGL